MLSLFSVLRPNYWETRTEFLGEMCRYERRCTCYIGVPIDCGSCDAKIRSLSLGSSALKRRFWVSLSGTFVLALCDHPTVIEVSPLEFCECSEYKGYLSCVLCTPVLCEVPASSD